MCIRDSTEVVMYRTVSNDFTPEEEFDYDMLLFFSPAAVSYTHLLKDKKQEKVFIRKEMFLFNNLPGLYFFPSGASPCSFPT